MTDHKVGSREEWLVVREKLLEGEKEHTRLGRARPADSGSSCDARC